MTSRPDPQTLPDALQALDERDSELHHARQQLAEARRELDDTNHGLIALYSELEAARHAEARLAAIVRSSDDVIVSMTPGCVIRTWNPGAQTLLGYPEAEIVDQPVETLLPPESREAFAKALQLVHSGAHADPYDTQWFRADGTLVDVAVTVSALRDTSGDLIGFSVVAQDITQRLAAQAALAAARVESEVLAERDRIARDLHDMVIQRVFGAGMALQGAIQLINRPAAVNRINTVIGELDTAIKELRSAIFYLHQPRQQAAGLRASLLDLTSNAQRGLRFTPTITFGGPIDAIPDDIARHVLAVVQEALSNVMRHAHASAAEVALEVDNDLLLQISDNGRGLGPATRASGLANLRERAEALGGAFEIASQSGAGARLRWRIPLPSANA